MTDQTRVLYNADCPVCSFEIDHYARYSAAKKLDIGFDDLNACDLDRYGVAREEAARRLHVFKNGRVYAGVDAFLVLWRDMPRYRLLARVVGLPGVRQLASIVYDYLLAPALYAWDKRRRARQAPRDMTR
jgi:predicted DCC family thiol-disulfide oxidoreductase YuxK